MTKESPVRTKARKVRSRAKLVRVNANLSLSFNVLPNVRACNLKYRQRCSLWQSEIDLCKYLANPVGLIPLTFTNDLYHLPSTIESKIAARTKTPFRTCLKISDRGPSASSLSISTPRFIGPGCIILALGQHCSIIDSLRQ